MELPLTLSILFLMHHNSKFLFVICRITIAINEVSEHLIPNRTEIGCPENRTVHM